MVHKISLGVRGIYKSKKDHNFFRLNSPNLTIWFKSLVQMRPRKEITVHWDDTFVIFKPSKEILIFLEILIIIIFLFFY